MIYLLRHGEIDSGNYRRFIGQLDLPLNDNGREQARRWQAKLSGVGFTGIYSSDLSRCMETARIVAGKNDICFLKELREISLGSWEGLWMEEVKEKFSREWKDRGSNFLYKPPGGESFDDLNKRVIPVFEKIAASDQGNILMVTHAGVIRTILVHILKIPYDRFFSIGLDYASMNLIDNNKNPFQIMSINMKS